MAAPIAPPSHDATAPLLQPDTLSSPKQRHLLPTLYLLILVVDFGGLLQVAPLMQIYEDIICRDYYAARPDQWLANQNHQPCKFDEVQSELAYINGMQSFLSFIPGLLLAIPYGKLVNRYGRRTILCLAMLGICLQFTWVVFVCWFSDIFPIRLVWLQVVFQLIGGGPSVGLSIVYVLVSDVTSERSRATEFFRLDAARLLAIGAGTACSSALMLVNTWLPVFVALLSVYLGSSLAFLVPNNPIKSTDGVGIVPPAEDDTDGSSDDNGRESQAWSKMLLSKVGKAVWSMCKSGPAVWVLCMAFLSSLGGRSTAFLLQFVSKRFGWSFAEANLITTLRAFVSLVVLLLIIPVISYMIIERRYSHARQRDLYIARGSSLAMLLGSLGIAAAPTSWLMILGVVIFTLGSGADGLLRSILTTKLAPDQISVYYTLMTLCQHLGESVSGPLYSKAFQAGLLASWPDIGLVFLVGAAVLMPLNVGLWLTRTTPRDSRWLGLRGQHETFQ